MGAEGGGKGRAAVLQKVQVPGAAWCRSAPFVYPILQKEFFFFFFFPPLCVVAFFVCLVLVLGGRGELSVCEKEDLCPREGPWEHAAGLQQVGAVVSLSPKAGE